MRKEIESVVGQLKTCQETVDRLLLKEGENAYKAGKMQGMSEAYEHARKKLEVVLAEDKGEFPAWFPYVCATAFALGSFGGCFIGAYFN